MYQNVKQNVKFKSVEFKFNFNSQLPHGDQKETTCFLWWKFCFTKNYLLWKKKKNDCIENCKSYGFYNESSQRTTKFHRNLRLNEKLENLKIFYEKIIIF